MTKKENAYYEIRDNFGNSYCRTGYSKYYKRLTMLNNNQLKRNEVTYGLEQAMEHAKEIKEKGIKGEYGKEYIDYYKKLKLTIVKIITFTEKMKVIK